jgi:hypothetical protein
MYIVVNDRMQKGYRYELSAQTGRDFDPDFKPELTPKQMLELGVFCGKYMTDTQKEFPESWFKHAKLSTKGRNCSLNYFGVDASQPLSVWQNNGWLHPDDPRGWFQWYCRYYMGRRMPEEDNRQIKRWKAFRRHVTHSARIVNLAILFAVHAKDKLCCTGPMIVGRFENTCIAKLRSRSNQTRVPSYCSYDRL